MMANVVVVVFAVLGAWFGWRGRIREGAVAAALLSAVAGLVAAFTIPLPTDVGGLWMFGVVFVTLTAASLAVLGIAHCIRRFVRPND